MSGQQWGSVIGGVIGSFIPVVGTALGSAIGGMIGGMVDPTKVYGPRLTDAQNQTAMDGVFRAYGDGTFPCKGNLIWYDITKEHKHTDDGKGSGQEQITYTYTRSYAIGVCKGPISGYKIIKRNGKTVFDARTDAELAALGYTGEQIAESRAAQAKFRKVCTLYYGTADQIPDPTMVAVNGVGNVPAYAGTAYIVLTDDETMQGEVAQYEFVVANCGDRTEGGQIPKLLVAGAASDGGDSTLAASDAGETLNFAAIPTSSGATITLARPAYYDGVWIAVGTGELQYSADSMTTWQTADTPWPTNTVRAIVGGPAGWLALADTSDASGFFGKASRIPTDLTQITADVGGSTISTLSRIMRVGDLYYADRAGGAAGTLLASSDLVNWEELCNPFTSTPEGTGNNAIRAFLDIVAFDDGLYAAVLKNTSNARAQIRRSLDGGRTWPDIILDATSVDGPPPRQLAAGNGKLVAYCWGADYVWTSANGFAEPIPTGIRANTGIGISDTFGRQIVFAGERFYIISGAYTPDPSLGNKIVSTEDGTEFTAPLSLPITNLIGIAAGGDEPGPDDLPIPDAPGFYIDANGNIAGPPGMQIDVCQPLLAEVVARQCAKRISTDVIDVSELTDLVTGFRVASPSSPQKNIGALMPGYFFDGSEFDGVLHFPKRGGEDSFALTVDDLCERDGDLIQWERTQEPELLRKITVSYLDPDTTYTVTTQQWERRSGTVKAEGEGSIELPVVGSKDWAARAVHKAGKVAWAESDKCTFHTSIAKAELVTAAVGTIVDEAGTIHRVRIERIEDEGLVRMIHARRTRADAYESTVTGVAKPLPLFPGSDIRGPTDGLLLNLPVIVDSNDVPGIAWAAGGFLSGWRGATLQFLRAGQWVDAGTVTLPATMGTLLAALPAHAGDVDTTNTLSVRMNDALESVTFTNLLQERNPLAIVYPDGTAEIVQFQTATEVAAGEYDLTTLIRGRLNTVRGDHAAGARVVFLDNSVQYAGLQPTDLGTTLTYRFVSLGTDPDAAQVQTMDLDTMQSQTEWPVADLAVEQDGDDYTLTWLARDRLGTDVFPVRSTNWRGYQVSWSYGGDTHTETVLTETVTFNLPGASDVTFSVSQLNLYTGAGPAQTVTIP